MMNQPETGISSFEKERLEQANDIFTWLQAPTDKLPKFNPTSELLIRQMVGPDASLVTVSEHLADLPEDERQAIQLIISGFDDEIIFQLHSKELVEKALERIAGDVTEPPQNKAAAVRSRTNPTRLKSKSEPDNSQSSLDDEAFSALDATGYYLRAIGQEPLLSAEEEVELSKDIEAGLYAAHLLGGGSIPSGVSAEDLERLVRIGEEAKARMINSNLRLAVHYAKKYIRRSGMESSDLIQAANLGLIHAVEKFDYKKGFKFSTYATWWIKQSLVREIDTSSGVIRLPVHTREKIRRIYNARLNYEKETGRQASEEELSAMLGFDVGKLLMDTKVAENTVSLNSLLDDDGDAEFGDILAKSYDSYAVEKVDRSLIWEQLEKELISSSLDQREIDVIFLRYGLNGTSPYGLKEIGEKYGLSPERVRQIQRKALQKLEQNGVIRELFDDIA